MLSFNGVVQITVISEASERPAMASVKLKDLRGETEILAEPGRKYSSLDAVPTVVLSGFRYVRSGRGTVFFFSTEDDDVSFDIRKSLSPNSSTEVFPHASATT